MQTKVLLKIFQEEIFIAFFFASLLKTAICIECSHFINTERFNVTSPNFPQYYPENADCTWLFETSPDRVIKIVFSSFDLEEESKCRYDYVRFFDGAYYDDPVLGTYCGRRFPPTVNSTTNKLLMVFRTDGSGSSKGFWATFTTAPREGALINFTTIVDISKPLIYEAGQDFRFVINVDAFPNISDMDLYWRKNGRRILSDSRYRSKIQNSTAVLEISKLRGTDSATYTLYGRTKDETNSISFLLEVNEHCINCTTGVPEAKRKLTEYFLKTRSQQQHSLNVWKTHITKTAVALFLSDREFFALGNRTGEEIAYELSLQLLSKLALGQRISTKDLSLFLNALTVACINPKDFYSIDVVDELRKRVNSSNFTNPYYILTLCNAKDSMTENDILKLRELYDAHFRPLWTDTQAMIVMALSCIHSQSNVSFDRRILNEMVTELKMKQREDGAIDKLKTTALVVQALLAAGSNFTGFNLTAAIRYIEQETNKTSLNFQDIYYTLPIFSSMSLTDINSNHCIFLPKADSEVIGIASRHLNGRIQIQISVIVDDDKDFIRSWKIKVPTNCSLYQALEIIGSSDSTYKVQYSVFEGKPHIVGIANYQDDTEDGLFWFIYTKTLSLPESLKLLKKSPVDIQVSETDELILWYRSGFWTEVEKSSSS